MAIFGLSSIYALISVLLIETAYWGKTFFENTLPFTLQYYVYGRPEPYGFHHLITSLVFLAKLLLQGVLWYAFLRNEMNKHGRLLKGWCWTGICLDLIAVSWTVCLNLILQGYIGSNELLVTLIPYLIIRCGIWTLAIHFVSDLSHKDKHLFPVGFMAHISDHLRAEVILVTLLTWEFIWYAISISASIVSIFFAGRSVLLPFPGLDNMLIRMIFLMTVLVSLTLLISIQRRWKLLLKLGLLLYIIFNVFGYVLVSFLDLMHDYYNFSPLAHFALLGAKILLPFCALGIKLGVVFGSLNLLCKPESIHGHGHVHEHEGFHHHEEKPLIQSRAH